MKGKYPFSTRSPMSQASDQCTPAAFNILNTQQSPSLSEAVFRSSPVQMAGVAGQSSLHL